MKFIPLLFVALLGANLAHAAPNSAEKARYAAAVKAAKTECSADRKLCADESSANLRMSCLKDAKAKYTAALKAAKSAPPMAAASGNEGRVISVNVQEKQGEGSGLGAVAGGVAGGLLGHQVGGGTGRNLATIAGVAGGAYAGHQVEKKVKASKLWVVAVKFNDGREQSFNFDQDPGLAAGDMVKRSGESIQRH
jgi:outer membrane lipoprotein SlyB